MSDEDDGLKAMGKAIQIDEARIRDYFGEMVRRTVEETLNALLDAEADRLCGAGLYEKPRPAGYPSRSYDRSLHTVAGERNLKVPKLRRWTFEAAIIERYRRRESSVEERDVSGRGFRSVGSRTSPRHCGAPVSVRARCRT
jgi:putative transposase